MSKGDRGEKLSVKRLMNDFKNLEKDAPTGVSATPDANNIYHWDAIISGPEDTPYENGTFHLTLDFAQIYPMVAPTVRFEPAIFHPNVYVNGTVCLDILNKQWSPAFNVSTILVCVQALLSAPNPESPANVEAAKLYRANRTEFEKRVKQHLQSSRSG